MATRRWHSPPPSPPRARGGCGSGAGAPARSGAAPRRCPDSPTAAEPLGRPRAEARSPARSGSLAQSLDPCRRGRRRRYFAHRLPAKASRTPVAVDGQLGDALGLLIDEIPVRADPRGFATGSGSRRERYRCDDMGYTKVWQLSVLSWQWCVYRIAWGCSGIRSALSPSWRGFAGPLCTRPLSAALFLKHLRPLFDFGFPCPIGAGPGVPSFSAIRRMCSRTVVELVGVGERTSTGGLGFQSRPSARPGTAGPAVPGDSSNSRSIRCNSDAGATIQLRCAQR